MYHTHTHTALESFQLHSIQYRKFAKFTINIIKQQNKKKLHIKILFVKLLTAICSIELQLIFLHMHAQTQTYISLFVLCSIQSFSLIKTKLYGTSTTIHTKGDR
jgi:hypothetical protein